MAASDKEKKGALIEKRPHTTVLEMDHEPSTAGTVGVDHGYFAIPLLRPLSRGSSGFRTIALLGNGYDNGTATDFACPG